MGPFCLETSNKRTVVVQSSTAVKYGIINYEENNKKFVPDQNSLLNNRDDDTMKIMNCSQWIVYTCKISKIEIQPLEPEKWYCYYYFQP